MSIGSFCLVLHGHLPYVLRHGKWPHGEDWLFEAAAETYLPLLALIDECAFLNAPPRFTLGLTPVLLEQLAHEDFKSGFEHYLADGVARASRDREEFRGSDQLHMAYLAERWIEFYEGLQRQFEQIGRNLPAAFSERAQNGLIEILTSAATHGYLPLLYEDSCIRAQLRAGLASSHRILGYRPTGIWLPECAYRPGGAWRSPVGWDAKAYRIGVEHLAADEGLTHFFCEEDLLTSARSEWVRNGEQWHKVGWEEAEKYPARGWRSVHEAHLVNSDGSGAGRIAALARDKGVCEQVWSGAIGYPAAGTYLEFHKKHGPKRGLRYWKITGKGVDLGGKEPYYPDDVPGRIYEDAQHFCRSIKEQLRRHRDATGHHGAVVACFDAELFGHWWFEGPRFLRDVILSLNADPEVELQTSEQFVEAYPPDKTVSMSSGSWGEGEDDRVWSNDRVNWMWDIEYRCEAIFGKMTYELPWREDEHVRRLLEQAGRELLLLQASDWQFVVTRGQAVDYGIKRFMLHVGRFETLIDLCEKLREDSDYLGGLNEVERHEIADAELHDVIFPRIELDWWKM